MTGTPEWMTSAACRGMDSAAFFPERGDDLSAALAVCASCPVTAECLAYGLELRQPGVWGGTSERDRRRMRTGRRALGPPRRDVVSAAALRQRRARERRAS